jgi:hypothetical protein
VLRLGVGGWEPPLGIEVLGGPLAALLLLLISVIILMVLLYAHRAVEREFPADRIGWYYVSMLLCTAGMMGLAISNDFFNMYVLMEIVGLSACALVAARSSKPALAGVVQVPHADHDRLRVPALRDRAHLRHHRSSERRRRRAVALARRTLRARDLGRAHVHRRRASPSRPGSSRCTSGSPTRIRPPRRPPAPSCPDSS